MTRETRAHIEYLLTRFTDGLANPAETQRLAEYLRAEQDDEPWQQLLEELMMAEPEMYGYQRPLFQPLVEGITRRQPARVVRLGVWRWVAAAAVMALLAVGAWLVWPAEKEVPLAQLPQQQRFKNDVRPAQQQVLLTLGDGSVVAVDQAADGRLATQGGTALLKKGDALTYSGSGAVLYNTVTTQRGKIFSLVLADGTRVWLDAETQLRFPTAFPGGERVVELSGQAYFEVAHDPRRPFHVKTKNQDIQVLGTHFNVNTYEAAERTTLVEGKVRVWVQGGGQGRYVDIAPGQQAVAVAAEAPRVLRPDVEEILAWKNGRFHFEGSSIDEIARALERWYDIDVHFKEKPPHLFVARIPREVPLSEILKLLELTGRVHFTIEGKKLTISN